MRFGDELSATMPPRVVQPWQLPASMRYVRRRPLGTRRRPLRNRVERPVPELGSEPRLYTNSATFLSMLDSLCATQRTDRAVDVVIDAFDELLGNGDAGLCNEILQLVDVSGLPTRVMLALLMETFRARSSLPAREDLYQRVDKTLRSSLAGAKVEALLRTLR